jgi:ASC-1-like (ASCH) protein
MSKNNSELMASAKAKMVAKGIDQSSCDKILGTVNIAEGETIDTLAEKGITEYNGFKQMFAPEGVTPFKPQSPDGKDAIESFMDRKAAEKESHFKNN